MFDDPTESLRKLQEQLLAAEEEPEEQPAPEEEEAELSEEAPEAPADMTKKRRQLGWLLAGILLELGGLLGLLAWWLRWR